ncbi:YveK family protein [Peribacillus sp. JNUCC 23]
MNLNKIPQRTEQRIAKEIDLKELYKILKKRIWIIVAITVLSTLAGGLYHHYTTTLLYGSSTKIIMEADADNRNTLQVIMKDSVILGKVIEELDLAKSPEALAGQITVESIANSQVTSISVVDTDPSLAAQIANTTASVFKAEIPKIRDFNGVRLLSEAKVNPYPINENQNRTIVIFFVFGLVVGIGLVFLLDSLDDTIQSEQEVEELLGLFALGSVPKMNKKNIKRENKEGVLDLRGETIGPK